MCMQPGVLLMGCLLALYLVAMVIFWQCLRGYKRAKSFLGTDASHSIGFSGESLPVHVEGSLASISR